MKCEKVSYVNFETGTITVLDCDVHQRIIFPGCNDFFYPEENLIEIYINVSVNFNRKSIFKGIHIHHIHLILILTALISLTEAIFSLMRISLR